MGVPLGRQAVSAGLWRGSAVYKCPAVLSPTGAYDKAQLCSVRWVSLLPSRIIFPCRHNPRATRAPNSLPSR